MLKKLDKKDKKTSKKSIRKKERKPKLESMSEGGSVNSDSITIPKYMPITVNIPTTIKSIFDFDATIAFSTNLDYSKFEFGFHHYIHSGKNKMDLLKQFEKKKKVYLVMNEFERFIDNYDKDLSSVSKEFFKLDKKPDILSREFYKLWEILFMFDVIDLSKDKFVSVHLAEGPGSFLQATTLYRDTYSKSSKSDKYYAITMHSDDTSGHMPEIDKKLIEYYDDEKPKRLFIHKTFSKQIAGGLDNKDDGDLTNPKTIKLFGGEVTEKADFITADGNFDWVNENIQEQEAFRLILSEIVAAAKMQKKGGCFVCKFFETFTITSAKFINILASLYNKVFFAKPLMSRPSNSEKFAVCVDFKYSESDKQYKDIIKKLDHLLKESYNNKQYKIVNLFTDYIISPVVVSHIIQINREVSNRQIKSINEIVKFINDQNYYGDTYQERREMQIEATKYWINLFFPDVKSHKEQKSKIVDISFISNKMNVDKAVELSKLLK
jgi:23S rRNA U2552 (ribose-2'-O)-methylase RlmE/FtsJ